nr:ORF 1 [Marmot picobirnavirus]
MTTLELQANELAETIRHNKELEKLQGSQLGELNRHNVVQEGIGYQSNVNDMTRNSQNYAVGMRNAAVNERNATSNAIQADAMKRNVESQITDRTVNQGINQQNADTNEYNADTNRSNWLSYNEVNASNIALNYANQQLAAAQADKANADKTLSWIKAPGQIFNDYMSGVNQLSNAVPIWGLLTK